MWLEHPLIIMLARDWFLPFSTLSHSFRYDFEKLSNAYWQFYAREITMHTFTCIVNGCVYIDNTCTSVHEWSVYKCIHWMLFCSTMLVNWRYRVWEAKWFSPCAFIQWYITKVNNFLKTIFKALMFHIWVNHKTYIYMRMISVNKSMILCWCFKRFIPCYFERLICCYGETQEVNYNFIFYF